jgi:dephospho-CoA kinase
VPPHEPSPLRIAFAGKMQVGKTTAADHLVRHHGFAKHALADPIKEVARSDFDWDGSKDERGRRLLQEIGTVGRAYDRDLWLRRLARRLAEEAPARVVVDDVRLEREVAFLEELGFTITRIVRGADRITTLNSADRARHETETELDAIAFDESIDNDGSFEELYAAVDDLVARTPR